MDRIEAYEQKLEKGEITDSNVELLPVKFDVARLQVKEVSNHDHERNKALADEIKQLWGIPIPRMMRTIKYRGYEFVLEAFNQVRKNPNASNPPALFLWTIKNCKVEMNEV